MEIKINDKQLKQIIIGYILGQAVAEGEFNLAEASDLKTIERILDKSGDGRFNADEDGILKATEESIAANRKNNFRYIYDPITRSWIDDEEIR